MAINDSEYQGDDLHNNMVVNQVRDYPFSKHVWIWLATIKRLFSLF